MSTRALVRYLDARQALESGDREAAAGELEKAMGSPPDNRQIRQNLELLLDHKTLAGDAILDLLRVEIGRKDDAADDA